MKSPDLEVPLDYEALRRSLDVFSSLITNRI